MFFLPLVPLMTVLTSICILTIEPKFHEFECCDVCWCYDDSPEAYAKKS